MVKCRLSRTKEIKEVFHESNYQLMYLYFEVIALVEICEEHFWASSSSVLTIFVQSLRPALLAVFFNPLGHFPMRHQYEILPGCHLGIRWQKWSMYMYIRRNLIFYERLYTLTFFLAWVGSAEFTWSIYIDRKFENRGSRLNHEMNVNAHWNKV